MSGQRILIVEDDEMTAMLATDLLELDGYRVVRVADAETALARSQADPPALIVTDLILPGADGVRFARALRENPATAAIPVVALVDTADDERRARAAGCVACLIKPINAHRFGEAVARALGGHPTPDRR